MDKEIYELLLRRLLFEPEKLSRNRNYHAFAAPEARRARRVAAHLRALRDAVLAADPDEVTLERADEAWHLHVPVELGRRDAWLTDAELALLREVPGVAARLEAADEVTAPS